MLVAGDDEAVDAQQEGVHAEHNHQERHDLEVRRPEVQLVDVVELHLQRLRYQLVPTLIINKSIHINTLEYCEGKLDELHILFLLHYSLSRLHPG